MPNLDRAFSRRLNDFVHGLAALPLPSGHRLRLMTVNGDADTLGTEVVAGGGYGAGALAPLLEFTAATDATPAVVVASAVLVPSMPRNESVVGAEIWAEIASVQTRLYFGAFDSPVSVVAGEAFELGAGDINSAMS